MEKTKISKEEALETIKTLRNDISEQKNHKRSEFISHFVLYIFVMTILWYVNLTSNPTNIWAIFPTLGWGMGLTFHFLNYKNIIQSEEKVSSPQEDFRSHLIIFLIVIAFLWCINIIQTP